MPHSGQGRLARPGFRGSLVTWKHATGCALSVVEIEHLLRSRRLWRAKVLSVHEKAATSVVDGEELAVMAAEARRIVARYDLLAAQLASLQSEIEALLAEIEEARWLATIPGLGFASVAGIIAHVGPIDRYSHGRQLIKLAGTTPRERRPVSAWAAARR
jgi:transposase